MHRKYRIIFFLIIISFISQSLLATSDNQKSTSQRSPYGMDDIESKKQVVRDIICPRQIELNSYNSLSYADWIISQDLSHPFSARPVIINNTIRDGSKICVIVNSDLYPFIESSITQYVADLTLEGFTVEVHTSIGGTPDDFRTYLQGLYASGMNGCLLVGDFPVAWYKEAVPI